MARTSFVTYLNAMLNWHVPATVRVDVSIDEVLRQLSIDEIVERLKLRENWPDCVLERMPADALWDYADEHLDEGGSYFDPDDITGDVTDPQRMLRDMQNLFDRMVRKEEWMDELKRIAWEHFGKHVP